MNKTQFLEELSRRLEGLSDAERRIALDFYAELISDRMEEGMSEEEAVAALGSIDQIVRDAAPELQSMVQSKPQTPPSMPDRSRTAFHEPVRAISSSSGSANISVLCAALPEGTTALVEYRLPKDASCTCRIQDGMLYVQYTSQRRTFSLMELLRGETGASIQVTLADRALVRGEITSSSGDAVLSGLAFSGSLNVSSSSGDISLKDVSAQGECSVSSHSGDLTLFTFASGSLRAQTVSGDANLQNARIDGPCTVQSTSGDTLIVDAQCGGALQLYSTSGDVEARDVFAGDVSASAVSGDVMLRRIEGRSASAESSSGDVALENIRSDSVTAVSKSGDIEVHDVDAQHLKLSTISGDIKGTLTGEYDFRAHSGSGSVRAPKSHGSRCVDAQSVSGDVTLHTR